MWDHPFSRFEWQSHHTAQDAQYPGGYLAFWNTYWMWSVPVSPRAWWKGRIIMDYARPGLWRWVSLMVFVHLTCRLLSLSGRFGPPGSRQRRVWLRPDNSSNICIPKTYHLVCSHPYPCLPQFNWCRYIMVHLSYWVCILTTLHIEIQHLTVLLSAWNPGFHTQPLFSSKG